MELQKVGMKNLAPKNRVIGGSRNRARVIGGMSSIYMTASYEELRKSEKKWEQLGKRASYENI